MPLPLPISPSDAIHRVIEPARMNVGDTFGRLKVERLWSARRPSKSKARKFKVRRMADCRCRCGGHVSVAASDLRSGHTRSCGCMASECTATRNRKHGMSHHPLYRLWCSMRARCKYPSATNYSYYGGRGIRVCDEWEDDASTFIEWAKAHGYRRGLEIDRIDNDGPYAPWNCRFIPHVKNSRKRRNAQIDEAAAEKVRRALCGYAGSIRDLAESFGVPYMVIWHIAHGNTWGAAS